MKRRKRVVIIEPHGAKGNVFSDFMGLPLMGPIYLGSKLKAAGHDVRVLNENILKRPVSMRELDADVCVVSAMTTTVERGYDILREYKALHPNGLALIGGVHATFEPEEAACFADHVITGEGEDVIVPAVEGDFSERIIEGKRIHDLDTIPLPDFTILQGYEGMPRIPMMTSRGCPFNCSFCSVTEMFGHRYRTNSVDRVLEEFRRLQPYGKDIFIYDDNFTASPTRVRKILEQKLSEGIKTGWTAQVRVEIARNPELVELMSRAGCSRVYVGFESIDNYNLKSMNKHQTRDDVRHAVEVFHKNQIAIHGMFIFGVDNEPPTLYRDTVKFCLDNQIDSVQFLILTPLPGTQFFKQIIRDGRLLHRRWQYYDLMHVVHRPVGQTATQLQNRMVRAFEEFYSLKEAAKDSVRTLIEVKKKVKDLMKPDTRVLGVEKVITKVAAQKIIADFKRVSRDYMDYLEAVDKQPPSQKDTDVTSGHGSAWQQLKDESQSQPL